MEAATAKKLYRITEEFRKLDLEIQGQTIAMFLMIAAEEGISIKELSNRLGMASSSASRNVAALSAHHRLGKAGHNLVVAKEDPVDRRVKRLYLTHRGRLVMETLQDILGR